MRRKEGEMQKTLRRVLATAGLAGLVAVACAALAVAGDPPRFSDWSAPVNLGPAVNDPKNVDSGAFISKDGLSLYFGANNRPDGYGQFDLYVSRRDRVDAPWGPAQNLGPSVNTKANEQTPALSADGLVLFFASDREDPKAFGSMDLYSARRADTRSDVTWLPPANLGRGVNTASAENGPAYFEDPATRTVVLYFSSNRPAAGTEDIYTSTRRRDGTFGPAVPVAELNTEFRDVRPAVRRDGLELYLDSNRTGTLGQVDLWVATRSSTRVPWSTPVNLGPRVNTAATDARPSISWDGTELYFHSLSEGGGDLFRCTRTKTSGKW
jgi:hypothetical protein